MQTIDNQKYELGEFRDLNYEFTISKPELAGHILKPEPHLNGRVIAVLEDVTKNELRETIIVLTVTVIFSQRRVIAVSAVLHTFLRT